MSSRRFFIDDDCDAAAHWQPPPVSEQVRAASARSPGWHQIVRRASQRTFVQCGRFVRRENKPGLVEAIGSGHAERRTQWRYSLGDANWFHAAHSRRRCSNYTSDYNEERDRLVFEKNLSNHQQRERNPSD